MVKIKNPAEINRTDILNKICYTELVYNRINKKLNSQLSRIQIEEMIYDIIKDTHDEFFLRTGKNIYVTNPEKKIQITINTGTFRIITVNRLLPNDK